jgi:hypothetical protein
MFTRFSWFRLSPLHLRYHIHGASPVLFRFPHSRSWFFFFRPSSLLTSSAGHHFLPVLAAQRRGTQRRQSGSLTTHDVLVLLLWFPSFRLRGLITRTAGLLVGFLSEDAAAFHLRLLLAGQTAAFIPPCLSRQPFAMNRSGLSFHASSAAGGPSQLFRSP